MEVIDMVSLDVSKLSATEVNDLLEKLSRRKTELESVKRVIDDDKLAYILANKESIDLLSSIIRKNVEIPVSFDNRILVKLFAERSKFLDISETTGEISIDSDEVLSGVAKTFEESKSTTGTTARVRPIARLNPSSSSGGTLSAKNDSDKEGKSVADVFKLLLSQKKTMTEFFNMDKPTIATRLTPSAGFGTSKKALIEFNNGVMKTCTDASLVDAQKFHAVTFLDRVQKRLNADLIGRIGINFIKVGNNDFILPNLNTEISLSSDYIGNYIQVSDSYFFRKTQYLLALLYAIKILGFEDELKSCLANMYLAYKEGKLENTFIVEKVFTVTSMAASGGKYKYPVCKVELNNGKTLTFFVKYTCNDELTMEWIEIFICKLLHVIALKRGFAKEKADEFCSDICKKIVLYGIYCSDVSGKYDESKVLVSDGIIV